MFPVSRLPQRRSNIFSTRLRDIEARMRIRPDCSDVLFILRPAHSSCTGASDILRHCSEKSRWLGRIWVKPGRSKRRPPPPDRPAQSVPWAPLPCRSQPLLPHTDGAFTTLMPRPYKRKHTADFRHAASSSVSQSILQPWRTATTVASVENTRRQRPTIATMREALSSADGMFWSA